MTNEAALAVVVAVGDASRRTALLAELTDHLACRAVGADDVVTALLQVERVAADVVLLDTSLWDTRPHLVDDLVRRDGWLQVLVVDDEPTVERLLTAIEAGADGYVAGDVTARSMADAVLALRRGESVVPPAMLGPLLRRLIQRQREAAQAAERLVALTRREREVLGLIADGLDHGDIAAHLVISPETARTHVQRVLRKLGVRSRLEAAALVSQTGLADRLERIVEGSNA